jgi:putative phosphoesterase
MAQSEITVGIISDTHGLLRPEALAALRGSDFIVHAGDIGDARILDELRNVAPTTAVRGNNDREPWAMRIPATDILSVGSAVIYVLHDIADLNRDPASAGFDVVVSGHSHKPSVERRGSVLFINPGSAGPRRFKLPISLATLTIASGRFVPRLVELTPMSNT